jgi:hypothetical protein
MAFKPGAFSLIVIIVWRDAAVRNAEQSCRLSQFLRFPHAGDMHVPTARSRKFGSECLGTVDFTMRQERASRYC